MVTKKPAAKKVPAKKVPNVRNPVSRSTEPVVAKKRKRTQTVDMPPKRKNRPAPVNTDKSDISRAGEGESAGPNLDATKLPMRWQIFIEEYLIDLNATQAAIRSGFTPKDAHNRGYLLARHPEIAPILQARLDERIQAIRMTRERVLDAFADMAEADGNELSELRRVCCRHCYGVKDEKTEARAYQYTPAEYARKRDQWEVRRADLIGRGKPDIGEFTSVAGNWYDKRKPIDPECPECFGDGIPEVVLKDTRNISRRARSIYGGVKEGKDGVEIKTYSKADALGVLAKHHKLYDDAPNVAVNLVSTEELDEIYAKGVADSDAKKRAVIGRGDKVRAEAKGDGQK